VKKFLKIMATVVSIAILWLCETYIRYLPERVIPCDRVVLAGEINAATFVESRDCLVRSEAAKKTFVVKGSGGGDGFAALALGILIHRHGWDVEIVDHCGSACAIFIFPAGKVKYLNSRSMLLFHGGPYQANILEMAKELDRTPRTTGAPAEPVTLGHLQKEGFVSLRADTPADIEVREFLSMNGALSGIERVSRMRAMSDRFYQDLGINPLLPTYGQIGRYERKYKSYEYWGFIYRLNSLRRLGIGNIELKEGEWHPELHPDYPGVYEVTYP
jgi:hypothetical protein